MAAKCELEVRKSIVQVYAFNQEKGKSWTVPYFRKERVPRSTVYSVLKTFEERRSVEKKPGSGKEALKLTHPVKWRFIKAGSDTRALP